MKINEMILQMTLEEKIALVSGTDVMYTNPVPRLGIKALRMSDGPHGLRVQEFVGDSNISNSSPATCFPTAVTLASGFNPENAYKMGEAMGREAEHYGIDLVLGPGVNIKRNPLAGRNFEYYSEDPYLAGSVGAEQVKGIQSGSSGVAIKHFALNNSENFRLMGDSVCDMRAIREIYLKPFEMIVKNARPETVMCSYNKINGTYASANKWLLTDVLRDEWGFDGLVMTDWGATHDRLKMLEAGLDLEMPGDNLICRKWIEDGIKEGKLSEHTLDKAVKNVLRMLANHEKETDTAVDFDLHNSLACEIAKDGAVLLKNDGALPLSPTDRCLVIGELFEQPRYQGSGSSLINPAVLTTPKEAFDTHKVDYDYVKGYRCDSLKTDNELMREAIVRAGEGYDKLLLFVGLTDDVESEGFDRDHMRLPDNQLALINALTEQGMSVVLVTYGGSPFEMPFADDVSAILNMYLPGQATGEATYSLLFGEASPCGKLAESWPMTYCDVPFGDEYSRDVVDVYRESVFVGYRYYSSAEDKVRYPFGYGLSYTEFEWSDMALTEREGGFLISVDVKNVGTCRGGEVVQLYSSKPRSSVYRPRRELRAFKKVYLDPEETARVELFVAYDELKYWNINKNSFVLEGGEYLFEIARDSLTPLFDATVTVVGESDSPYSERVMDAYTSLNLSAIDDALFEEMSGLTVPEIPNKKPITLESRFIDLRHTLIGKAIFKMVMTVPAADLRRAKRLPDGHERSNKIKGAIFTRRAIESGSLTTISMCSSGRLPYNFSEGFCHLSNGKILKGLLCFLKKIKAPKLPKEME